MNYLYLIALWYVIGMLAWITLYVWDYINGNLEKITLKEVVQFFIFSVFGLIIWGWMAYLWLNENEIVLWRRK